MARDEGGAGAMFAAFILGALAGAAAALLWAPAPGDQTRRYLQDRAREGKERASDAAQQGREFIAKQRDNLTAAVERGREAYRQAREGENV